jgi:hypothetical protein
MSAVMIGAGTADDDGQRSQGPLDVGPTAAYVIRRRSSPVADGARLGILGAWI